MKRRKHSKVLRQLPDDLIEAVNNLLVAGRTYQEITDWLNDKGHEISKSSIGRYGKDFLAQMERLKIAKEQAKTIVTESGDAPATEMAEAASQMAMQLIMEHLMEVSAPQLEGEKLTAIFQAMAKLEQSGAARERVKLAFNKGVNAAADRIKEELRRELASDAGLMNRMAAMVDKQAEELRQE